MEKQPCGTNGVSKIKRIPYETIEKLGRSHKIDGKSLKEYKEAI